MCVTVSVRIITCLVSKNSNYPDIVAVRAEEVGLCPTPILGLVYCMSQFVCRFASN